MARQKKRAYLVLIAIGVAALAIDRFVLSDGLTGPSTALALTHDINAAAVSNADSDTLQASSIPELPFPHELKSLGQRSQVRDLFAPPVSAWDPNPEEKSSDKSGSITGRRDGTGEASAAARMTQRRLTGVFITEGLKIAVVDKTRMGIGQILALAVSGRGGSPGLSRR